MDTISLLANKIYEYYVVNPYAIAIQQPDGKYITKYVPFDASIIEVMIRENGSAGCYQQGFKNGLIKWICMDFDCKNKENPEIDDLWNLINNNLLSRMDELNISYLTEFSGRRGIHVWVIFNHVIPKKIGFVIINELMKTIVFDSDKFDVDLFPMTESSSSNKVGKQVKLPLSCHRIGGRSFFFENAIDINCIYDTNFFEKQYEILTNYKLNSPEYVCIQLGIDLSKDEQIGQKYKKYEIVSGKQLSAEDIMETLSSINVYKAIFERLMSGHSNQKDWYVLLGTIGCIDKTGNILKSIFAYSASFDEKTTERNILLWKDKYHPATFNYLYKLYDMKMESEIEGNETGLDVLARHYDIEKKEIIKIANTEKRILLSIESAIQKEKNYILANDENIVVGVWNKLRCYQKYDVDRLNEICKVIAETGEFHIEKHEYYRFQRYENAEKERMMIILGAEERVLTTHLAMKLAYNNLKSLYKSFSYNVSFLSDKDIFYNWYTSWGNYISKIKTYIEMPFMSEWGVITLDIKGFYDNIDFLTVFNIFSADLDDESRNIFLYLLNYNEDLMREITGKRFGVPQGPAYARIIAELFLNRILEKANELNIQTNKYHMYRYVDDIIIFYQSDVDAENLYTGFAKLLIKNGLTLNTEKSKIYGKIGDLSKSDRDTILRKDRFNYALQVSDYNTFLSENEKKKKLENSISENFRIEDVAYIFSKKTDSSYVMNYYKKYAKNIFSSIYGRGSIFLKFYEYVFENNEMLAYAIEDNNLFAEIKINSLNFKNCISMLYLIIQRGSIDLTLFSALCTKYLLLLDLESIDEEERITIESLFEWNEQN